MNEFTTELFFLNTLEAEKYYFTGESQKITVQEEFGYMESGIYRVVDGELYRIIDKFPVEEL